MSGLCFGWLYFAMITASNELFVGGVGLLQLGRCRLAELGSGFVGGSFGRRSRVSRITAVVGDRGVWRCVRCVGGHA